MQVPSKWGADFLLDFGIWAFRSSFRVSDYEQHAIEIGGFSFSLQERRDALD